ncbi:MAG: hypothetical protein EXQ87_13190 [Alphaproteobacteria bacterium]|nr:hypothetical protein [Alphaproteobacteria bacterium]
MNFRVLDPTNEAAPKAGGRAPRLASLKGKTVGFISNGKEGTKRYFAHLEAMLRAELGVAEIVMRTKSNYSAPADAPIMAEVEQWDAVVAGIGD